MKKLLKSPQFLRMSLSGKIESYQKKIKEKIKLATADFPGDKNKRFPYVNISNSAPARSIAQEANLMHISLNSIWP